MKIWKFPLGKTVTDSVITVQMPKNAKILHVRSQKDVPCVWTLVDPEADTESRYFYIAATGETVPDGQYLGTVFQYDGAYVWHIFER